MKTFMVVLIIAVFCLTGIPAFADFEAKVQLEVRQEIAAFYQRNGELILKNGLVSPGNRITIDLMDGLMLHLNQIFDANVIVIPKKVEPKPEEKKIDPVDNK